MRPAANEQTEMSHEVRGGPADTLATVRGGLSRAVLASLPLILLGVAFGAYHVFDFHVFWRAGEDVIHGRSPYPPASTLNPDARDYYVYPPLTAVVMAPFAVLPFTAAAAIFSACAVGAVVGALWLLEIRDWRCYAASFLWVSVLQAVGAGTFSSILVLLLALAWRYRSRNAWGAAAAVATALALKLFVWPLVVWLAATRRFAAAAVALAGGAALALVSWAVIGFSGLTGYPHLLRRLAEVEELRAFSIPALTSSLGLGRSTGYALLLGGCVLAVVLIVVVARGPGGDARAFVLAIACSLVLSPIVWLHYFSLLLVPIAIASRRFGALWLVPVLLFLPDGDSHGDAWRIGLALAVTAAVTAAALVLPSRRPLERV